MVIQNIDLCWPGQITLLRTARPNGGALGRLSTFDTKQDDPLALARPDRLPSRGCLLSRQKEARSCYDRPVHFLYFAKSFLFHPPPSYTTLSGMHWPRSPLMSANMPSSFLPQSLYYSSAFAQNILLHASCSFRALLKCQQLREAFCGSHFKVFSFPPSWSRVSQWL